MNSGPVLFLTLFVAMSGSWLSFVLGPQLQLGDLKPTTNINLGAVGRTYPTPEVGDVHQGAEVYRANGCAACHTQQVRPLELGSDIRRGWGVRRSTAYDYLYQQPVLLGSLRVGPDLANAGRRMDLETVLVRLYEPRQITANSIMPSYAYLFTKHKIMGEPSPLALKLDAKFAPETGYEIIPKPEAVALATYVTGLHQDGYLYEAPPTADQLKAAKIMQEAKAAAEAAKAKAEAAAAKKNSPAKK